MMAAPVFLAALLATGVAAGGVGAILGLGGGILLVPILTLLYGIDLRHAMGASIVSVIATTSGAAAAYLRSGLSNLRIGLFLAMATVLGAITGASLVGVVPRHALELILGLALGYSAVVTFRQLHLEIAEPSKRNSLAARFELEGSYDDALLGRTVQYRADHVGRGLAAMFGAGVLSGLLGIGSGAFKVLAMDYFMRLPMKVSTATSNFMIGITASASAAIYLGRGEIDPRLVAPVGVGVLVGAYLGTRLMEGLRNTTLRTLFLPVILYLAASMVLRGLQVRLPW